MTVPDELPAVLRLLEQTGLPYAVTGSIASIAWGTPRATYDADVVIQLTAADVVRLIASFPAPDWYLDRDMIHAAIAAGGEFNAIHGVTGTKIDFWIKTDRPADAQRFARRRRSSIAGVDAWVLSPEDTLLAKLEWLKAAPSDRQEGDIAGILAVQGAELDMDYIRDWAERLGVRDILERFTCRE